MVIRAEKSEWLTRIGVVAPQRIRQVRLDCMMMGLILVGVGIAVPDLPTAVAVALRLRHLRQPLPLRPARLRSRCTSSQLWYRALAVVSFIGVSGGLVAAAIVGPGVDHASALTRPMDG